VLICLTGVDLPIGQMVKQRLVSQGVIVEGVSNALTLSSEPKVLDEYLATIPKVDFVIHGAELDWQRAEENPAQALRQSVLACSTIVNFANNRDVPLILLSSFMVFDGSKKNPYISANSGQPINAYGHAKLAVENFVLENYSRSLLLRLGWLMDESATGWLGCLMQQLLTGQTVSAYTDIVLSPTATVDVARVIDAILKQLACGIDVWGLYHYAGTEPVSHENLVKAIQYQALGQDLQESQIVVNVFCPSEQGIQLPKNAVLGCIKLRNTFGIKQLPWRRYLPALVEKHLSNADSGREQTVAH